MVVSAFLALAAGDTAFATPHVFSCPQGVVAYRAINKEHIPNIDETLKAAFAANPNIDPKDYEQSLSIILVRFDRSDPSSDKSSRAANPFAADE